MTAFDAEQAGDVHFLAMEFVEGTDLATVVKQRLSRSAVVCGQKAIIIGGEMAIAALNHQLMAAMPSGSSPAGRAHQSLAVSP